MSAHGDLARVERIVDCSATAERIEPLLATGVRSRQLMVRTLLIAMVLTMQQRRDAFLTNIHRVLLSLPEQDQRRLGVTIATAHGDHQLTYRQVEYTCRLVCKALAKPTPDGQPSQILSEVLDQLLEASVQVLGEPDSTSYAVDWTDIETWSRPPPKTSRQTADTGQPATPDTDARPASHDNTDQPAKQKRPDTEAAWGHRTVNHPAENEMFYGYYLQAVTIVRDEHRPEIPELVRRMHLAGCDHDPPAQILPVLAQMTGHDIQITDLLIDSGYSYRLPEHWALPLRQQNISLIMDLHPNDRGPHGTHQGATIANGNLYCPATPQALLQLQPLPPGATLEQTAAHDKHCAELARYKLAPITRPDPDGYRRVICPAIQKKLRCPHRPASLTLPHDRPTVSRPPEHPPACCQQQTITVPPAVNAKTAQKHDYPSPQHRASYRRRTAAERAFSSLSDRATNDLSRGWCRLFGLAPIALVTAAAVIARNIRIHDAFYARQAQDQRRAASQHQRRRRRQTTQSLTATANSAPP